MTRAPRDSFLADLHTLRRELGLTAGDVNVATVLATAWSNADLKASWPSQRTIADACGVCVRSVRYSLAALEAAGVLVVDRHSPRQVERGRWTRRTNRYRFMWVRLRAWAKRRFRASPQRAPRGKRLPQEPVPVVQVTPVVPARPPPGVETGTDDDAEPARNLAGILDGLAARYRIPDLGPLIEEDRP